MLVILSDLHFVDGTAGDHNVPAAAFALWLDHVIDRAEHNKARELIFLYLGDIFDFLRTERWFFLDPKDRPWGSADLIDDPTKITPECRKQADGIGQAILENCAAQLAFLRGDAATLKGLGSRWGGVPKRALDRIAAYFDGKPPIPIRRIYAPGNHDRLYLLDADLKAKVDRALGVDQTVHTYVHSDYALVARHGHEWDAWNFERHHPLQKEVSRSRCLFAPDREWYLPVPIGDAITTEIASRLPFRVRQRLQDRRVPPETIDAVYRRLQNIDNVRPLFAAVRWALGRREELDAATGGSGIVATEIEEAVKECFGDFMNLSFTRRWLDIHRSDPGLFNESRKLKGLHGLVRNLAIGRMERILGWLDAEWLRPFRGDGRDALCDGAVRDLNRSGARLRYGAYGHTHQFRHRPSIRPDFPSGAVKTYLNSGTWRTRVVETADRRGFEPVKEMTYLIFYREDEAFSSGSKASGGVGYETWSGLMMKPSPP